MCFDHQCVCPLNSAWHKPGAQKIPVEWLKECFLWLLSGEWIVEGKWGVGEQLGGLGSCLIEIWWWTGEWTAVEAEGRIVVSYHKSIVRLVQLIETLEVQVFDWISYDRMPPPVLTCYGSDCLNCPCIEWLHVTLWFLTITLNFALYDLQWTSCLACPAFTPPCQVFPQFSFGKVPLIHLSMWFSCRDGLWAPQSLSDWLIFMGTRFWDTGKKVLPFCWRHLAVKWGPGAAGSHLCWEWTQKNAELRGNRLFLHDSLWTPASSHAWMYSLSRLCLLGLLLFLSYRDILNKLFLLFAFLSNCFVLEAFKILFKTTTFIFTSWKMDPLEKIGKHSQV